VAPLAALVALLVAAVALVWWLRRTGRTDEAFGTLFASLASICLIVAVTLLRSGWPHQFSVDRPTDWSTAGVEQLRSDTFGTSQFMLNVAVDRPGGMKRHGSAWSAQLSLTSGYDSTSRRATAVGNGMLLSASS
jgi:hypothetical protein